MDEGGGVVGIGSQTAGEIRPSSFYSAEAMARDSERENKVGNGKVVLCVGSIGYTRHAHWWRKLSVPSAE
jgi:hypothetical protein